MFKTEFVLAKRKLYYALGFIIFLLILGTFVFNYTENWSYINSFYFSVSTLTTVGYGDLVPSHDISKIVTSIYALLGVGIFLYSISIVSEHYFYKRLNKTSDKLGLVYSVKTKAANSIKKIRKLK